jgi:hypothetical protein
MTEPGSSVKDPSLVPCKHKQVYPEPGLANHLSSRGRRHRSKAMIQGFGCQKLSL